MAFKRNPSDTPPQTAAERLRAFRRRHGRTIAVVVPPLTLDDLKYLQRVTGAKSQRATITNAITTLARLMREGGTLKVTPK